MKSNLADVIVVGGGTLGLAAAYHAAQRGLKTAMIDQFAPPPGGGPIDQGSSRGLERMFRILYSQPPRVRLVETAYAMWHEMQQQVSSDPSDPSDRILLEQDLLFFGNPDISTFEGNIADIRNSMNTMGIPIDDLQNPAEIAAKYPIFNEKALYTPDGTPYVGLVQNSGATINVPRAFQVTRLLAERTGRYRPVQARVVDLHQTSAGGWHVTLADGETWQSQYLIVCPGVWLDSVLAPLGLRASQASPAWSIWQMTLGYFNLTAAGKAAHWPIWYEFGNTADDDQRLFYGFPNVSLTADTTGKMKISADYAYPDTIFSAPNQMTGTPDPRIIADLQKHLAHLFKPGLIDLVDPDPQQACVYSMAPDGDIVLGRIPLAPEATQFRPNAAMLCMASGRGFKYTPVFGRILVDLAVNGATPYQLDLADFSPTRPNLFQKA